MSLHANTDWAIRAFLQVKAALTSEIATPSGAFLSEDYVRSAMLRGLMLTEPTKAARVRAEWGAPWSGATCMFCAATAAGRTIQHDIAVPPVNGDGGLVCEVKWLKQAKSSQIMADIWKVALTRTTTPEQQATRALLLIGGEANAFSNSLATLAEHNIRLRWSPQGRARGLPRPTTLPIGREFARGGSVFDSWEALVGWSSKPRHYRTCPDVWASLNAVVRDRWLLTIGPRSWRAVLWELDHRGVDSVAHVNWHANDPALNVKHQAAPQAGGNAP